MKVVLELEELEADHLKRAVLAHYARTMLASVTPGLEPPTTLNRQAAQTLYGKVETACPTTT